MLNCDYSKAGLLFFFLAFSVMQVSAQNNMPSCKDVREGVFYFYPKNMADKFVEMRDADNLYEWSPATGDSASYKTKWLNDCTYSLNLTDAFGPLAEAVKALFKKHKLIIKIETTTTDYYTFESFLDKTSNLPLQNDTIWLNEKVNLTDNLLFRAVPDSLVFQKPAISDTSRYALLYVYRPGKLKLSMANYLLYFDNNLLCVAKNSSGYVFRILKEGNFELKSRLNKDESSLPFDIHFGRSYYVKTEILWSMYKHLSNYKLINTQVSSEQGESEFQNIKHF